MRTGLRRRPQPPPPLIKLGRQQPPPLSDPGLRQPRRQVPQSRRLVAHTDPEEWDRGGLGQDVHALLDADPHVNHAIETVYVATANDEVAFRCLLILIDAAGRDGLAEWTQPIERRPALATDDLAIELRRLSRSLASSPSGEGDPSRWNNERGLEWIDMRPKLVVEVTFDHTSNDRIRHGTKIVRWRDDKKPSECLMEQLAS